MDTERAPEPARSRGNRVLIVDTHRHEPALFHTCHPILSRPTYIGRSAAVSRRAAAKSCLA